MKHLMAGVGRSDITPAPGTPQGGWGAQTHQRGIGADLPLYATALALSDSRETVAIVDVDGIGFDDEWTERILDAIERLTQLPRERIRFSCTHTHSPANTFRLATITEGRDMILSYLEGLPLRIAGAAWQALENLTPVRCAAGSGQCDINVNRRVKAEDGRVVLGRNWQGSVDRTVRVIRFDDLNEKPVATIVHYACHPTTMAWENQYFTPDYPGMVKKVVEEQVGGTCVFLQGATGSLGPRRGFTGDLAVYRKLGKILGLEAAKVALNLETLPRQEKLVGLLESGTTIVLYDDVPVEPDAPALRVVSRMIDLPLKAHLPPEQLETEAADLREKLNQLRKEGAPEQVRAATARATQAGMRAERSRLYYGKSHLARQLMGIRIGEIALVSMPGEPFNEIAQEISARSPFPHTLFSGYSNGGFGYLPIRSAFTEGGYEVETTPYGPDAAEAVVRESLRILEELKA